MSDLTIKKSFTERCVDCVVDKILPFFLIIFLCISICVSVWALTASIIIFTGNQKQVSHQYIDTLNHINNNINNMPNSDIEKSLEYAEALYLMQKNSSSTDIIFFLYSFLSSVLIGVGTALTAKSAKNAKEARKSYKEADKKLIDANKRLNEVVNKITSSTDSITMCNIVLLNATSLDARLRILETVIDSKAHQGYVIKNLPAINTHIQHLSKMANELNSFDFNEYLFHLIRESLKEVLKLVSNIRDKIDKMQDNNSYKDLLVSATDNYTKWIKELIGKL